MAYRTYANTNGFIVAQNGTADFMSISSAIAAINEAALTESSIYLTDGTYTENITLPAGCLLSALPGANYPGYASIIGEVSFSGNGTVTLSGINLITNSSYCVNISGTNTITVIFTECNLTASNFTGILGDNPNAILYIIDSNCVVASNSFSFINVVTLASSFFSRTGFGGGSNIANNFAANLHQFYYCIGNQAFSTSGTGSLLIRHCIYDTNFSGLTIPMFQLNSTSGLNEIEYSELISGAQSTISIANVGVLLNAYLNSINCTAASGNALIGNGTALMSAIVFPGSASGTGNLTLIPHNTYLGPINNVGTSGQVLTSNGPGVAPTFQTSGGGSNPQITIFSPLINFLDYSAVLFYTPPAGKYFVISSILLSMISNNYSDQQPALNIGITSPNYSDYVDGGDAFGNITEQPGHQGQFSNASGIMATNSTPIYLLPFNVGSDATTSTGYLILTGYLTPET